MYVSSNNSQLISMLSGHPYARADVFGNEEYLGTRGTVEFFNTSRGTLVLARISGLPTSEDKCKGRFFGFHIHSGGSCTGNSEDSFADAGTHYNPDDCPHPYHAGDMPSLIEADGYAFLAFLSDRFNIDDVIGKTVVIHDAPDDFTTQPAGNAGNKIACGVIMRMLKR